MIAYTFAPSVPMDDIEASLLLALLGAESLHGATSTRLEAAHSVSRDERQVVIDETSQTGRDLNRLFLGYATREFGADAFEVRRLSEERTSGNHPRRGLPPPQWN